MKPYWVVVFLTVYMPLETVILKFLPGSDQLFLVAQFGSEILIYLTFILFLLKYVLLDKPLRKTPLDRMFFLFIGVAILTIVVNQSPLIGGLINIRSLLRYVILFYLVVNIDMTHKQAARLVKIILTMGFFQIIVGFVQLGSGGVINQFLLPRQTEISIAGQSRQFILLTKGREFNSIFGTLGDTLFFGLYMLIVLALSANRFRLWNARHIALSGVIIFAIGYSYARAALFGVCLLAFIVFTIRYGRKILFFASFLMLPLIIVFVIWVVGVVNSSEGFISPERESQNIIQNITGIFSREYIEIAKQQRLGALIGILPTVLANRPLLGFGPDEETTIDKINHVEPNFLYKVLDKRGFEDVYWVAFVAYYGLIGATVLILLLYKMYRSAKMIYQKTTYAVTKDIALAAICMCGLTVFLLFFYRVLEFRVYSFHFWLLFGLLFNLNITEQRAAVLKG